MSDAEVTVEKPSAARRPWWRLHLSTFMILAPVVFVLAALVVPRQGNHDLQQGWPQPFLVPHKDTVLTGELLWYQRPAWRNWDKWFPIAHLADLGIALEVSWAGLAVDVAFCLAVLSAIAIPLEWRRRRRRSFWQFTIAEGLAAMLACAAIAGWLGRAKHLRDMERAAFVELGPWLAYEELRDLHTNEVTVVPVNWPSFAGPAWLRRLAPEEWCVWFDRYQELEVGDAVDGTPTPAPVSALATFRCLARLTIGSDAIAAEDVARLAETLPLQSISLCNCRVPENVVLTLIRPGGPERVSLSQCEGDWPALAPRLQRLRPDLIIEAADNELRWRPGDGEFRNRPGPGETPAPTPDTGDD